MSVGKVELLTGQEKKEWKALWRKLRHRYDIEIKDLSVECYHGSHDKCKGILIRRGVKGTCHCPCHWEDFNG